MEFYSKLNIDNYTYIPTEHIHLTEEKWKLMIMTFCIRLAEKSTGKILIDKLTEFINNGYDIKVANYDSEIQSSYIYPKIIYKSPKNVLIIIPSVPYFVETYVLVKSKQKYCNDYRLNKVFNYFPANELLSSYTSYNDNENQINWIKLNKIPQIIGFAHELIHCLRHFEKFDINHPNEEEHTIYGIGSNTLSYCIGNQKVYITENSIRKNFGFKPRISHYSKEFYCWGVSSTYENSNKITQLDFFK
jgi:hypothetical protein